MKARLIQSFYDTVRIDSESGKVERFLGYIKEFVERELSGETFIDAYGKLVDHLPADSSPDAEPFFLGAHGDTGTRN